MTVFLELNGITKSFPGVLANDDISFTVKRGEIHALLGENGAGKSTLVKMIYGMMQPDAGTIQLHGAPYAPASPAAARMAGIGMVFQHFSLFEALTVAENIALGIPGTGAGTDLGDRIRSVSSTYKLPLNPDGLVGDLSVGERQRVEIVRCLMQSPSLLIMDEPTSVLTPQEADLLFATLRKLSEEGIAILYISHRLSEIQQLCDAATVLRAGKVVADCDPRKETARSLAEMMIGETLAEPEAVDTEVGETIFEVRDLSRPAQGAFGIALDRIGFDVKAGEILGIGGMAGNGQSELMEALIGETLSPSESMLLQGRAVGHLGPSDRRRAGMAFAPEERLGHAVSPTMSLADNTLVSARHTRNLTWHGVLRPHDASLFARRVIASFDVRTTSDAQIAQQLSGGNLQKFVVGREILQEPRVLIVEQPTWGVDAAAAAAVHRALVDLAQQGAAVVVISQDLDELVRLSNRIAVLSDGRLSRARPTSEVSVEEIGLMMGGEDTSHHHGAANA